MQISELNRAAVLLVLSLQTVFGHKCYVCLPDKGRQEEVSQLKRQFANTKIPLCSQYKASLKDNYLLNCPDGSNGCLTMFDDDGSIIRTCAPIQFDECKKANSVNYCYCSKQGCNSPDNRLPDDPQPSPSTGADVMRHSRQGSMFRQQPVDGNADGMRPRQGHELDFSAPRIQQTYTSHTDDEDLMMEVEGSADDWESTFYYDSYYDTADHQGGLGWTDDTELDGSGDQFGDGGGFDDMVDMTEPPPFIQAELDEELERMKPHHKFDRVNSLPAPPQPPSEPDNEIVFEETSVTLGDGGRREGGHDGSAAAHITLEFSVWLWCLTASWSILRWNTS